MADNCEFCHEYPDGGVKPLDKSGNVFLYPTLGKWMLHIQAGRKNLPKTVDIRFCPMCGRRLNNG